MTLDNKLREILQDKVKVYCDINWDEVDLKNPPKATYLKADPKRVDKFITDIKQAFADKGYRQINVSRATHGRNLNGDKLPKPMTGQEWYDRFEKELSLKSHAMVGATTDVAKEAARKAAGL